MRVDELAADARQRDAIVEAAAIRAEHEADRESAGAIETDAELRATPRARLSREHGADALGPEAAIRRISAPPASHTGRVSRASS